MPKLKPYEKKELARLNRIVKGSGVKKGIVEGGQYSQNAAAKTTAARKSLLTRQGRVDRVNLTRKAQGKRGIKLSSALKGVKPSRLKELQRAKRDLIYAKSDIHGHGTTPELRKERDVAKATLAGATKVEKSLMREAQKRVAKKAEARWEKSERARKSLAGGEYRTMTPSKEAEAYAKRLVDGGMNPKRAATVAKRQDFMDRTEGNDPRVMGGERKKKAAGGSGGGGGGKGQKRVPKGDSKGGQWTK